MASANSDSLYYFGYIARAHGIRGELRIQAEVDNPQDYSDLKGKTIYIGKTNANTRAWEVDSIRWLDEGAALLKLKGIATRNESELLAGNRIFLDVSMLPPIEDGGFYYHDIIGFKLIDRTSNLATSIQDVIELPAQDVFQVFIDGIEVLIPIVDEWILAVDFDKEEIEVKLPIGLIDLYLEEYPRTAQPPPQQAELL